MNKKVLCLLIFSLMFFIVLVNASDNYVNANEEETIQIALLLDHLSADDLTWNYNAVQSLRRVVEKFEKAEIMGIAEGVTEADAEPFMLDYIDRGANLIIANTFGHFEAAHRATAMYPDVVAVFPGGDEQLITEQVGTYYPKTYEATYLVGMTAGLMSETGKVGYVVCNPIPLLLAETNSFILGAQNANPDIEIEVAITGAWHDASLAAEAARSLVDEGVDFIGFQENTTAVIDVAVDEDIWVAPPFLDQVYLAPDNVVVSSLWNWDPYFEELIESLINDEWESSVEYWGIDKGMADISEFNYMVSEEVREEVFTKRDEIIEGTFEVPYIIDENLWEK